MEPRKSFHFFLLFFIHTILKTSTNSHCRVHSLCAGGHCHWVGGAFVTSGSQALHPKILRARKSSFSACTISSSAWPFPIAFSSSVTSLCWSDHNFSNKVELTGNSILHFPLLSSDHWRFVQCIFYRKRLEEFWREHARFSHKLL